MPDRRVAAAVALGVVTVAVFAPALHHEIVLLALPTEVVTIAPAPGWSVALHALGAALVLLLAARCTGRLVPSVLAAALFAVHPLRVESIFWAASGDQMLGMAGALLTMLVYESWARRGGAWRYTAAVATYAVAVRATPLASPVPLLLLLLDAWPLRRLDVAAPAADARLVRRLGEKLPFAVLAAVALGSLASTSSMPALPNGLDVANAFAAVARYLGWSILPIGLTPIRPVVPPPWWTPGAVLGVGAITAVVVAARMRAPALAIGWLWFLIALVPALVLPLADRFTYLPSVGLVLALAGVLRGRALAAVALVAVAVCIVTTNRQLGHWADEETVLRHALAVTDDNVAAERRLAALLAARGAWEEAAIHAREAARLQPADPETRLTLGEVLLHEGHAAEAAEHFAAVLAARPDFRRAGYALGRAEQQRGRLDAAIAVYRRLLESDPDSALVHASLARVLRQRGALAEAREHFERALALGGSPTDVLGPLAQTLAEAGDLDGAAERYRALLALTPDDAVAHDRLGTIAVRQGDLDRAETEYRSALSVRPDLADAQLHLGTVLAARAALHEALAAYEAALAAAPRLPSAQYSRALVLAALDDRKGAIAALRAELVVQPNWPPALLRLAALLADGPNDRREAGLLADRAAASLGPDDPDVQAVRVLLRDGE